jgi:hypothetical protein
MPQNRTLGDKARYVCPYADCQNRQKCIFAQNYFAIFAIALAVIVWGWNPSPGIAANFTCFTLINNGNRVTSAYSGSWGSGSSFYNNRPSTLALVRDYCHDNGAAYSYSSYYNWGANSNIIATRAVSIPDSNDFTDYVQSWDTSTVASKLGCAATAGNQMSFPGINQIIAGLPQSPANMRIPTLINKMAGENSLAGNLAIELYSGVWQFLGILTSFKLFKTFFKGG